MIIIYKILIILLCIWGFMLLLFMGMGALFALIYFIFRWEFARISGGFSLDCMLFLVTGKYKNPFINSEKQEDTKVYCQQESDHDWERDYYGHLYCKRCDQRAYKWHFNEPENEI